MVLYVATFRPNLLRLLKKQQQKRTRSKTARAGARQCTSIITEFCNTVAFGARGSVLLTAIFPTNCGTRVRVE